MVTIKDVAQDAGVAVGTVSKVLNGQHVSEKNRIKVEASVTKLGYQMNFYARGLKTKNTYTIAVIVPEILNPFFAEWVYYIEQELYKNGYKMLLCNTQGMPEKEEYYYRMAEQNKVDEQRKISGINNCTAGAGYGTKGCGTFIKENKRGRD